MRRIVIWQYVLMGAAWAAAIAAWPLRAVELNGFLGWNGTLDTSAFVRFLFEQPRSLLHDAERPAALQAAWLSLVLAGIVFFIFAPTMVRRRNVWRAPGQKVIRLLALVLLVFPLGLLAPVDWHFPRAMAGMYVLAAAHVVMFVAMSLTPAKISEQGAFPVEPKLRGGDG